MHGWPTEYLLRSNCLGSHVELRHNDHKAARMQCGDIVSLSRLTSSRPLPLPSPLVRHIRRVRQVQGYARPLGGEYDPTLLSAISSTIVTYSSVQAHLALNSLAYYVSVPGHAFVEACFPVAIKLLGRACQILCLLARMHLKAPSVAAVSKHMFGVA